MSFARARFPYAVILLSLHAACGSTPPPVEPDLPVPTVTGVVATDVGNLGNGSDLQITFARATAETLVASYRVMVVESSVRGTLDAAVAGALSGDRVVEVAPAGADPVIELDGDALDVAGQAVREGVEYVVAVLTVGTGAESPALTFSNPVTLENAITTRTIAGLPASTGGVDVDAAGMIYVADIGAAPARLGSTVYRIEPTGAFEIFAQGSGLLGASGNAFAASGDLLQSNFSGGSIVRIALDGAVTPFATGLAGPVGIAVGVNDTAFVATCADNTVTKVSPSGQVSTLSASGLLSCPNGIAFGEDGQLYVANFNNGLVVRVSRDGRATTFATIPGGNNGHLIFRDGLLHVVGRGAHQIFTIESGGAVSVLAGTGERGHTNGPAAGATFSLPNDLAFSPDGDRLYVNEVAGTTGTDNSPSVLRAIVFAR